MPASGWINRELEYSRCYYVSLFPGSLILLNSLLSIIPIILVAVLYSIILIKALKNVKEINAAVKPVDANSKPELRINRGNTNIRKNAQSVKFPTKSNNGKIKRSVSFSGSLGSKDNSNYNRYNHKSKSIDAELDDFKAVSRKGEHEKSRESCATSESNFSICTVSSSLPENNDIAFSNKGPIKIKKDIQKAEHEKQRTKTKIKEPNKWRAIIVVMLTSGSFIFTWMPFFITVIFYVFCQEKLTNPQCMHLRIMLSGPIATLAFLNSILNPLIYAWWHKGFQRSMRTYFRKYLLKFFQKDGLR